VDGKRNIYLINGDFVDRGSNGLQILATLCLLIITQDRNRSDILINRGNHELQISLQLDIRDSFANELKLKYKNKDLKKCFETALNLFCSMPICYIFDKNIFVTHGVPRHARLVTSDTSNLSPYSSQKFKTVNRLDSKHMEGVSIAEEIYHHLTFIEYIMYKHLKVNFIVYNNNFNY
jgi:hypothetical protein